MKKVLLKLTILILLASMLVLALAACTDPTGLTGSTFSNHKAG